MSDVKVNLMGSEVVDGFVCKPKVLDPEKPIMHFKTQIFLCHDERCKKAHKSDLLSDDLREILKEVNLARGPNRIKISRTGCFGACRFRSVANLYENTRVNGHPKNNNLWLRNIHKYKPGTSLGAWVRRIMINTSIDFYRKSIRRRTEDLDQAQHKINEDATLNNKDSKAFQ